MQKSVYTFLFALLCVGQTALSTDYYMADGSIISGFISDQPTAKDSQYTIAADSAYLILDNDENIEIFNNRFRAYNGLDDKWKKWADTHPCNYDRGEKGLYMAELKRSPYGKIENVHVAGSGSQYRLVILDKQDFKVNGADIVLQVTSPRDADLLSGLDRSYKVKNISEPVEGQLVEMVPGVSSTIMTKDGNLYTINKSDILEIKTVGLNDEQPLLDQTEYLDIIELKDNSEYSGVISLQNYPDLQFELTGVGSSTPLQTIKFKDVKSYKKKYLGTETFRRDVILGKGKSQVNSMPVDKPFPTTQVNNMIAIRPNDSMPYDGIRLQSDDELKLYVNLEDGISEGDIIFLPIKTITGKEAKKLAESFVYDDLIDNIGSKKNSKKDYQLSTVYAIPFTDLFDRRINFKEKYVSRNNTTTLLYHRLIPGKYAFYNTKTRNAIIVDIIE